MPVAGKNAPEAGAPEVIFSCPSCGVTNPLRLGPSARQVIRRELMLWDRKLFSEDDVADWIVEALEQS